MADELPITDPAEIARRNAETIQKQGAQDISGQPAGGPDNFDGRSSLDALRDQAIKAKTGEEGDEPIVQPVDDEAKKKADADAAAAAEAAKGTAQVAPVVDEAAKKKAEDEAAAKKVEDDAVAAKAAEIFKDSPSLPPNASARSGEAFTSIKTTAAKTIRQLEVEKADLAQKLQEAETKLKEPLPAEVSQELQAHREFRAKLDLQADPKFKSFDKEIADGSEFIYAQLKKSPVVTEEVIASIKQYGGPENVDMEKILAAVKDPMIRRLVEGKLAEIAVISHNKGKAIESNQKDITKYIADREKEWKDASTAHNTKTRDHLNELIGKIDWMNPKKADDKADVNAKKAVEAHNQYAEKAKQELELAISDDSPEMRATLLVGMQNLFRLQIAHEDLKARFAKLETEYTSAVETANRLKASSTSRLRESNAVNTPTTTAKKGVDVNEPAGSALDRMRAEKIKQDQQ